LEDSRNKLNYSNKKKENVRINSKKTQEKEKNDLR
jgi:hypothetical protein